MNLFKSSCACGLSYEDHEYKKPSESKNKEWKVEECTREAGPTDAFGDVKFVCNNKSVSKVIFKSQPDLIFLYFEFFWSIHSI